MPLMSSALFTTGIASKRRRNSDAVSFTPFCNGEGAVTASLCGAGVRIDRLAVIMAGG
jgi:hypothetical protein